MKSAILSFAAFFSTVFLSAAGVKIDEEAFGKNLGGWKSRDNRAAEYSLSGSNYRTYKPEISPTPEGGIFVSIRIDNVRGWLASDDHAILEITVNSLGQVVCAQSNIAIQGRSISSDVIRGGNEAGKQLLGTDRAVQIGTDLVADLSAKLLREKIVEAGRVSFPAVLRHNYNLLYQAIRVESAPDPSIAPAVPAPAPPVAPPTPAPVVPPAAPEKPKEATPPSAPGNAPLQIKPYGTPG